MEGFRSQRRVGTFPVLAGVAVIATLLLTSPAQATIRLHNLGLGKLEVSGNVQTQNIVRHRDIDSWEFVQQRNVFRARVDWELISGGKLMQRWKIPGVRKSKLFLLYRGMYDSIYDYTPDVSTTYDARGTNLREAFARDGVDEKFLTLEGIPENERDSYKFENSIREVYIDMKMSKLPLSVRIGKQQVVWGEADNFRMLDRVNPLDLTWHLAWEIPPPMFGWDELRRPLFMTKFLYDLGNIGPVSQSFIEAFWNPGDWYPGKIAFLPRPWGVRLLDPLTNPWDGAFNGGPCITAPGGKCSQLMNDTRLFEQGDYSRWDPTNNSQVGARFHGYTPFGLEFTLNYLYQRWSGDDGTNFAPIQGLRVHNVDDVANDPATLRSAQLLAQGIFPAEAIQPYINTFGLSANYSDETYTQTVFRLETVLDMGIPFFDRGKLTTVDDFLPGVTQKNMFKSMVGFDRPTWVRWINNKTTVFFSGQWFTHHVINNPECPDNLGDPNALQSFIRQGKHCLTGGLDLPSSRRPKSESFRDKIRDWESIFTFAAFTFYKGGSVVPVIGYDLDPVNNWDGLAFWTVDWFVTPTIALNLSQRYFINPTGSKDVFETWGLNSFSRTRSETALRITYNF